jgi:hypothetical protein
MSVCNVSAALAMSAMAQSERKCRSKPSDVGASPSLARRRTIKLSSSQE